MRLADVLRRTADQIKEFDATSVADKAIDGIKAAATHVAANIGEKIADGIEPPPPQSFFGNLFGRSKPDADTVERNTDRPLDGSKTTTFVQDQTVGTEDVNSVDYDDVNQGNVGDCSLMSSMAALAKQDPDAIKRAIKNEKYDADGHLLSCTVTLYKKNWLGQLKPHEVNVDCSKFPQSRAGSGDEAGGVKELWPMILEKAFAQNNVDGYYAKLNKGVSMESAMEALTGREADDRSTGRYAFDQLQRDLGAGKTITFATEKGDGKKKIEQDGHNLVGNHAYAVVGTHVDESGQRWVKLYNPWGPGNTQPGDPAKAERDGGWLKYEDAQRLLPNATVGRR